MGIGMFRRNYDEQPVAQVAPASAPAVEVGETVPATEENHVTRSSTKAELKDYLASEQGGVLTPEQEAMTKAELADFIFGSEA